MTAALTGLDGRSAALLVNVRSRHGQSEFDRAARVLIAAGVQVRPVAVHDPEEAERVLRRELTQNAPYVIVGGGDGTLSHAAGVLARTATALALLPLGTGNTFARSVGVPLDLERAARLIAAGHRTQVDVGLVNGRVFLNSVGLGLSAEIARTLTPAVKRRLGLLAWPWVGIHALRHHQQLDLDLQVGAALFRLQTHQFLGVNGRYVAGPLRAAPHASIADQQLDLLALGDGRLLSLLRTAVRWAAGASTWQVTANQAWIRSRRGAVWVGVDGEVMQATHLALSVVPGALWVIVPQGYNARQV